LKSELEFVTCTEHPELTHGTRHADRPQVRVVQRQDHAEDSRTTGRHEVLALHTSQNQDPEMGCITAQQNQAISRRELKRHQQVHLHSTLNVPCRHNFRMANMRPGSFFKEKKENIPNHPPFLQVLFR